jgi:hypothetical protein
MEMETEQMMAFLQLFEEMMMAMLDAHHKSLMASLGLAETNIEKTVHGAEMTQSVEEHQDIPTEDAAVAKPANEQRKWHRSQKSTAGRRREPKELTRGNCGSRRKLAAACRKVPHHATVSWLKGNSFGELGPRKIGDGARSWPSLE